MVVDGSNSECSELKMDNSDCDRIGLVLGGAKLDTSETRTEKTLLFNKSPNGV